MRAKLLIVISFISVFSFAQFKYGVKGGIQSTSILNTHIYSKQRLGFNIGVIGEIPLDKQDIFYLQGELNYSTMGERSEPPNSNHEEIFINFIRLPIMLKAYISQKGNDFYIETGLVGAYKVSDNISDFGQAGLLKSGLKNFDVSFGLGLGYSLYRKTEFNVRFTHGLTDSYQRDPGRNINYHTAIQVGVSYFLN